ncbi:unnamed protein product [Bemisia tabaci]|uniref:Uncharacterized protein n=2 Tax=Bemisia tabaci TaxID=7038 RepID=A0A9P0A3P0_BEMTA|nr:unnamed protein product [Bemisia tabaci]
MAADPQRNKSSTAAAEWEEFKAKLRSMTPEERLEKILHLCFSGNLEAAKIFLHIGLHESMQGARKQIYNARLEVIKFILSPAFRVLLSPRSSFVYDLKITADPKQSSPFPGMLSVGEFRPRGRLANPLILAQGFFLKGKEAYGVGGENFLSIGAFSIPGQFVMIQIPVNEKEDIELRFLDRKDKPRGKPVAVGDLGALMLVNADEQDKRTIEFLLKHVDDAHVQVAEPLLYVAAKMGEVKIVKSLLENGVTADVRDGEDHLAPLHLATHIKAEMLLDILIHHGADVNCKDKYNRTPLHYAATIGWTRGVEILLENGATVNVADTFEETTPLDTALDGVYFGVADLLIRHGAKVKKERFKKYLRFAAEKGDTQLVKLLLSTDSIDTTGKAERKTKKREGAKRSQGDLKESNQGKCSDLGDSKDGVPKVGVLGIKSEACSDSSQNDTGEPHQNDCASLDANCLDNCKMSGADNEPSPRSAGSGSIESAQDEESEFFGGDEGGSLNHQRVEYDEDELFGRDEGGSGGSLNHQRVEYDEDELFGRDEGGSLHQRVEYDEDELFGRDEEGSLDHQRVEYDEDELFGRDEGGSSNSQSAQDEENRHLRGDDEGSSNFQNVRYEEASEKFDPDDLVFDQDLGFDIDDIFDPDNRYISDSESPKVKDEVRDDGGISEALLLASRGGHTDTVRLLLEHGANANHIEPPWSTTALHNAVAGGHKEVIELLLNRGADPEILELKFFSALTIAALRERFTTDRPELTPGDHVQIIDLLLSHGADINSLGGASDRGPRPSSDVLGDTFYCAYSHLALMIALELGFLVDPASIRRLRYTVRYREEHRQVRDHEYGPKNILGRYLVKLQSAGLLPFPLLNDGSKEAEHLKELIEGVEAVFPDFRAECETTVAKMKRLVPGGGFTYLDLLSKSPDQLATLSRNEELVDSAMGTIVKEFPLYWLLLEGRLNRGAARRRWVDAAGQICHRMFNWVLRMPYDTKQPEKKEKVPYEVVERIVRCLTDRDLRYFVIGHENDPSWQRLAVLIDADLAKDGLSHD